MIEHFKSKLFCIVPKFFSGITIGNHVFYRSATPPEWLKKHEAVHVKQFAKHGLIGYFIRYWYEYIINGFDYHKIPFEIEAYNISAPEGYHGKQ
ncbi:hypothetical protein KAR91_09095 [Candidatus Pacearchaeota archaeon]|nr:hypothetical protein [Candidatus Pacearchaeota archaeon]